MRHKKAKAYFTVEAAVLYPIVLGIIVLMTYLLFFQYDRCLLDQDMGRAAVIAGGKWMEKKEELNRHLQTKELFFDNSKYIAWETELPIWKLERNQVTVEQTGRLEYPFPDMGTKQKYWSARASFQVERNNPIVSVRTYRKYLKNKDKSTDYDSETDVVAH